MNESCADTCWLALKVDVDTYRGTLEGVPALLDLFAELEIRATFLFSLGPDHTGRALRRMFRRGFLGKVRRTSVASHYGLRTLVYGVLLPGPHIARRSGHVMRRAQSAGHEIGVHAYDHVRWQDTIRRRDRAWTEREMDLAWQAFRETFGTEPATSGAAGWQINAHVPALQQARALPFASDTRGRGPFLPVMDGAASTCIQLPTTLPTLDELLGREGLAEEDLAGHLLGLTAAQPGPHVYTLHAELEGMKLMSVFRALLTGWRRQGWRLGTLGDLHRSLDLEALPDCEVCWAEVSGRSGTLASQGDVLPREEAAT